MLIHLAPPEPAPSNLDLIGTAAHRRPTEVGMNNPGQGFQAPSGPICYPLTGDDRQLLTRTSTVVPCSPL